MVCMSGELGAGRSAHRVGQISGKARELPRASDAPAELGEAAGMSSKISPRPLTTSLSVTDQSSWRACARGWIAADAAAEVLMNKRSAVVIHPERIVSWDHSKLGGTY